MNRQTADDLIEKAVKKAIKEYGKEQELKTKRKALHNTKLLLRNYKKIQSSIEEAVSEISQLENECVILGDEDELYVESIRRSKLKSIIVTAHIDKALAIVQEECYKKNTPEKYNAFISCMMEGMSYEEAAVVYNSSKPSISRWLNELIREVSVQLFGVDGVNLI